jgi:hypothetical protein
MAATEQTMKAVLERLRRENSKAIREADELVAAVTEMLGAEARLEVGMRELAAEACAIGALADEAATSRLKNLAAYAARLSESFSVHVAALQELKKGLDGWRGDEGRS